MDVSVSSTTKNLFANLILNVVFMLFICIDITGDDKNVIFSLAVKRRRTLKLATEKNCKLKISSGT